jgi:hypothetical protein
VSIQFDPHAASTQPPLQYSQSATVAQAAYSTAPPAEHTMSAAVKGAYLQLTPVFMMVSPPCDDARIPNPPASDTFLKSANP